MLAACLLGAINVSFDTSLRVSAGVYATASGALVRTLFSRAIAPPGASQLPVYWDGADDEGNSLAACAAAPQGAWDAATRAAFTVRAIGANVSYVWEGVVGNSGPQTGLHVLRALFEIADLDIADGLGSFAYGYTERIMPSSMWRTATPALPQSTGHENYHSVTRFVANDGELLFYANVGVAVPPPKYYFSPHSFVFAINATTNCEVQFPRGRPACDEGYGEPKCVPSFDGCNGEEQYYSSTIGYATDANVTHGAAGGAGWVYPSAPTGLAVQRAGAGRLLAVARGNALAGPYIEFFDKASGASLGNATVAAAGASIGRLRFSADGRSLWAVAAAGVLRLDGMGGGGAPPTGALAPALLIPRATAALSAPGAIAVSPLDGALFVADEARNQVLVFDPASGAQRAALGVRGGAAAAGPAARPDAWDFANASYLALDDDGSLWVGDAGSQRTLHLAIDGDALTELGAISFVPASYASAVPAADATRIFSAPMLEFSVNYSLPLGVPGAWSLARNWGAGADRAFFGHTRSFAGFRDVAVVQGRTFALAGLWPNDKTNSSTAALVELVEPSAAGAGGILPLRLLCKKAHGDCLCADGSLNADGAYHYAELHTGPGFAYQSFYAVPLAIDAAGAASYACPSAGCPLLAAVNLTLNASDSLAYRVGMGGGGLPTTADGRLLIVLDAQKQRGGGMHLGALPAAGRAGAQWAWKASPWGAWRLNWTFSEQDGVNVSTPVIDPATADGRFGADDAALDYPTGRAVVDPAGPSLVYSFSGEGWLNAEANQFLHWHAPTGLFVGQFGTPNKSFFQATHSQYAQAGQAGNSFNPSLVRAPGGALYLYHNDESQHDGVHRWRFDGAETLRELEFLPLAAALWA